MSEYNQGQRAEYNQEQRIILLDLADNSIRHGLKHAKPLMINLQDYTKKLQETRACFVTLHLEQELRGCIGSLNARRALVEDVAHNAFAAAFSDPRFAPLSSQELELLTMDISILTKPETMSFSSEQDLLRQLRPGIDGLILSDGSYCGTFLPSVWEQLPLPREFLQHLKNKAGLPANYWSASLRIERYTTEVVS